jgi:hypothetical protein
VNHDNLVATPTWGERATVLADIMRWRGGGSGHCEFPGCGAYETRRTIWLNIVEVPPPLYRLSLMAPRTRAADVALETYLAGAMRRQMLCERGELRCKRLCLPCALQVVEGYDFTTETARKLPALRARPDGVSLCFIATQAGTGVFPRFVVSGATRRLAEDVASLGWRFVERFWELFDQTALLTEP